MMFDPAVLLSPSPSVLVAVALVVVLVLYYWLCYLPYQTLMRCGIKGPTPLPFIGNAREIFKMGTENYLQHLHFKYGTVSGFYSGFVPVVVVFDPDLIKQIFVKQFEDFHDRDNLFDFTKPPGLIHAQGEEWKTARQTLSPSFSAAKMRMMIPLITKSTGTLLEKFGEFADSEKSYDMFRVFGLYTMEVILAVAFGRAVNVQRGEADEITKIAENIFAGLQEDTFLRNLMEVVGRSPRAKPLLRFFLDRSPLAKQRDFLRSTMLKVIQARRQSGKTSNYKDLLQLMIDTTGEEELEGEQGKGVKRRPLTDEQIVSHSVTFVLAGYETTANTLSYVSYLLALNPEAQSKLQNEIDDYFEQNPDASVHSATQELKYLDMVIQESLRIYPAAPRTVRWCPKKITVNGVTFPKECTVLIPIKLIQNLPQHWNDPEKFDPERFTAEEKVKHHPYAHLPFGFGPRSCIGMRLAMLEAKIALVQLLRKFSFVQAPETEVPLQTVIGITMSPKNGTFLRIVARN